MPDPIVSTADVATDRPGRYGKQLVSHLSRRSAGTWDDDAGAGSITFTQARATLSSAADHLHIELTAQPEDLDLMEGVVGRHLVRFGTRDELVVAWKRSDGTAGTEQRNTGDEPGRPDGPRH